MGQPVPITRTRLGMVVALLGWVVLVSEGPVFGKDQNALGSTQRFRGFIGEEQGKARRVPQAKVSIEQAIKAATEKVPGIVLGAELEYKTEEMAVWALDVLSVEGKEVHMSVDAETGHLLEHRWPQPLADLAAFTRNRDVPPATPQSEYPAGIVQPLFCKFSWRVT